MKNVIYANAQLTFINHKYTHKPNTPPHRTTAHHTTPHNLDRPSLPHYLQSVHATIIPCAHQWTLQQDAPPKTSASWHSIRPITLQNFSQSPLSPIPFPDIALCRSCVMRSRPEVMGMRSLGCASVFADVGCRDVGIGLVRTA